MTAARSRTLRKRSWTSGQLPGVDRRPSRRRARDHRRVRAVAPIAEPDCPECDVGNDLGDRVVHAGDTALGVGRRQSRDRLRRRDVRERFDQQLSGGHARMVARGRAAHRPPLAPRGVSSTRCAFFLLLSRSPSRSSRQPAPRQHPRHHRLSTSSSAAVRCTTAPAAAGQRLDLGIKGDKVERLGDLSSETATTIIDASGKAVAPGFINMLSWSVDSLDGRRQVAGRHPPGRDARNLW